MSVDAQSQCVRSHNYFAAWHNSKYKITMNKDISVSSFILLFNKVYFSISIYDKKKT